MKRTASLSLVVALVLTQFLSAKDDKEEKQKTRHDNANAAPARVLQKGQRLQTVNPGASARSSVRHGNVPRVSVDRPKRQFTPNVVATPQTQVANAAVMNRNWRNRRNWSGNTNSQNNNVNNANQNWRNNDSSTSDRDWQNRSGNWEGNRNRWSGRHNWDRRHRNRSWWRSNYTRFALFGGGYYYWNGGYWYPAYGYDPYFTTYSYDAPIYAYNDQDPGQVIAEVQAALNRRGYYSGGVDGTYGPMTRRALLNFQRDNGLPVTGQIDESTLDSLGFR